MKSTELRIGNIIINGFKQSNGFPDFIDRVVSIAEYGETNVWSESVKNPNGGSKCLFWFGIPLTEEWAKKISSKNSFYNKDTWNNTLRLNPITIDFGHNDGIVQRFNVTINDTEIKPTLIQYVHQLQNLYFALTGEELEIK